MSSLTVQNIQGSASSSNTINVASGHKMSGNVTHGTGSVFPAGHVIQVVHVLFSDSTSISSSTFTDVTGATLTITPKFASSKIYLETDLGVYVVVSGSNYAYGGSKVLRGSSTEVSCTNMTDGNGPYTYGASSTGTYTQLDARHRYSVFDSPNTTSATTYKVQGARYAAGSIYYNSGGGSSRLIAMEIAQ